MANVLLINPPLTRDELFRRGSAATASIIPPLGLAYIAAVLEARGHKVEIIDGIADDITVEETVARARGADIVGITVLSSFLKRALELVRQIKSTSGVPVIAGGAHATAMPMSLLEAGVDFIVLGEGEETTAELVDALVNKAASFEQIRGIAFLKNGQLVQTEKRPLIRDLDSLPMPARHLLPMEKYKTSEARTHRHPSHSMMASRGCKGCCTFCFKGAFGTDFRIHTPQRIFKEMAELRGRYHAQDISFWDDSFTTDKKTVLELCRLLVDSKFGIPWSCEARIDTVDEEMLRAMKAAGCEFVAYGIESGSDRVLKSINKRLDTATIRRVVRMTKSVGMSIRGYFMLGFVGETEAEMKQTIDFAVELDPEIATFTLLVPFPGTADYVRASKEGGSFDPDFFSHNLISEINFLETPVYCPQGITPERLLALHREAYRRFYYRPSFIWKEVAKIKSFKDVQRLLQGAKTLLGS